MYVFWIAQFAEDAITWECLEIHQYELYTLEVTYYMCEIIDHIATDLLRQEVKRAFKTQ